MSNLLWRISERVSGWLSRHAQRTTKTTNTCGDPYTVTYWFERHSGDSFQVEEPVHAYHRNPHHIKTESVYDVMNLAVEVCNDLEDANGDLERENKALRLEVARLKQENERLLQFSF